MTSRVEKTMKVFLALSLQLKTDELDCGGRYTICKDEDIAVDIPFTH